MDYSYEYGWAIKNRGYSEVSPKLYSSSYNKKGKYVERFLSPSIKNARCGWDHCEYVVMRHENGNEVEYAVLCPESSRESGRYINVSGDSLGAIAEAVWTRVFR